MAENWTPGEWRAQLVKGSYKRPALVMSGDKLVAQCMGDQLDPGATSIGEAAANAWLLAAAKDLYAELKNARAIIAGEAPQYGDAIARIDAALAKARGEGGGQ